MKSGFHSELSPFISQLKSLAPTMHTSTVLGYCAIYQFFFSWAPCLRTKVSAMTACRLSPGPSVTSGAVLLGHKHHVDTVSCGQMCFFSPCSGAYFCLFSAFLCTCVSSSLPPLLPALSLLVTHAGRFSVYKINVAAHLLLLGNSQTINKTNL